MSRHASLMPSLRPLLAACAALLSLALLAPAAQARDGLSSGALYYAGPGGRYLMGGDWLFRLDSADQGVKQRFMRTTSTSGWTKTTVPNAWNATDESSASMAGSIGWYRKDFRLPSANRRMSWVLRFESVNYRARFWMNGKPIGSNTGAYLPFEIRIPSSTLKRHGTNRLVVRVDSRRLPTDFPPSGLTTGTNLPTGGWWNYGGILREVYLRKVDRIDFNTVVARPELPCSSCDASVLLRTTVRNASGSTQRVRVRGSFGGRDVSLGTKSVGKGEFASFSKRIKVRNPRLWAPGSPTLYTARFSARVGDRQVASWRLKTGIRKIDVSADGHLLLNGRPLNFRGVGLHEDDPKVGFAVDNARRDQYIAEVSELGATLIRAHYPLHPYLEELADRDGILLWSEVPVYAVKTQYLKRELVRKLAAKELAANINANQNHPSIVVWSLGNELSSRPGPVQGDYIRNATAQAKKLDPTRPVGLAVAGYPSVGCQPEYGPLDVIGINDYFGWYPGPNGVIADRDSLSDYLEGVRGCYPKKAIVVTEFGAEANRNGPVEEKGTYEFQQDFVNYHLGVYASKPWLSGAIYWAIEEFRVRPGWEGGNPRPHPPIHEKGLLTFADRAKKPAWFDVNRWYTQTQQIGPVPGQ
jgi:beta-glucuronidase